MDRHARRWRPALRSSWLIPAIAWISGVSLICGTVFARGEGGSRPALAGQSSSHFVIAAGLAADGTPDPPTPTPSPTPTPTPPPHPSSAAGLRVWSNGDSTSYYMSVAFLSAMQERGAIPVQPAPEYKISSGLVRSDFFDWPAYLAAEMQREPDVVVFMIGANDALQGMAMDQYRQRVGAVMDQLRAPGRWVLWVGEPNMGRADLAAGVRTLNQVFAEEAAARPWVTYVDTWSLTSDSQGSYQEYLPGEDGALELVRVYDGVHFTPAGGRRLAAAVIAGLFGGGGVTR